MQTRSAPPSLGTLAAVLAVFTAAALFVYGPSLGGPFFSDDIQYILGNPFIQGLSPGHLAALLDPGGDAAVFTWNYAPVHLLAHALEWSAFGADPVGYRVVNILLHALVSTLLVAFLAASGLGRLLAVALGAVFLLHPANVEAVAWIFQLKTILALGLSVGALLAFRSRPGLALALFTLALLSKVAAVYALPVAICWRIVAPAPEGRRGRDAAWLGAWAAVTVLCLVAEFPHFQNAQIGRESSYAGAGEQLRSIFAIAGRYLVMVTTTRGLSAFHEPLPATSWLDPRWLFGAAAVALLSVRACLVLWRRQVEAIYWAWAGVSFAAVSQIFGFLYPMGDRYLYLILPGLLGAAGFVGTGAFARVRARLGGAGARSGSSPILRVAGLVLAAGVALLLGARSLDRAALWGDASGLAVIRDAAAHYPEGRSAAYLSARRAALRGDLDTAAVQLERLAALGHDQFGSFFQDPVFAPLFGRADFEAALAHMADNWIRSAEGKPRLLQADLRALAQAYVVSGDLDAAIRTYQRALDEGGPFDEEIRGELAAVRQRAAAASLARPGD